ncbi:homeobox-leucine zipper protein HAT3-like [Silene latifolia]|uniref:homeobox-leucine zipper protein HAT3-like n=1 Tax=Silene latifolia TaxID=37657 RepID=UPI003D789D0B
MMMPKTMEMDVKPAPLVIDLEEMEKTKVGSPNSTLSSNADAGKNFGGFQGDRDVISDDEEGGSGGGSDSGRGRRGERKKLRLSKEQIMVLERAFGEHTTLNTKQKLTLAREVKLKPRQVEVWFQNRRARTKLKQTEVDCEYLRRFSETLKEQNMKLQKEVQELRAAQKMGLSDQSAMHGQIMCSSCKSVSLSPSFASSSKTPTAGVLHRPAPLNLKKLSLTINNNMFVSNLPRV